MSLSKYQKRRAILDETNLEKLLNAQILNNHHIFTMSLSSHKSGDIVLPFYLTVIEVKSPESKTFINPQATESLSNQYYNMLAFADSGMHSYYAIHFEWWEFFEVRSNIYKMKESEGKKLGDFLKILQTFYLTPGEIMN